MGARITDVTLAEPDMDHLLGLNIEQPVVGDEADGAAVAVVGWVLGRTGAVTEVVVSSDDGFWRTIPVDQARPDLVAAFPDTLHAGLAGFRTQVGLRGMTRATLTLTAKLGDDTHVYLGTISLERVPGADPAFIGGPGTVDLGDLRRVQPISGNWGYERGLPIDRHYIEGFLERFASDVHGHTLEIGDDSYARRFGGRRLTDVDILDIDAQSPVATFVADLADASQVPSDRFDAAIVTQTLDLIYDVRAAVATLHRILAPGGVLLATFPGISPVGRDKWADAWSWGLTVPSAQRLFEEFFRPADVQVESFGNALTASALMQGLAREDLTLEEMAVVDPSYPVTIAVRAQKRRRSALRHGRSEIVNAMGDRPRNPGSSSPAHAAGSNGSRSA